MNLRYKPDWFLQRNPLGLVPVIEYQNHIIYESAVCDDFLEETDLGQAPDTSLSADCPYQRATDRILMYHFDSKVRESLVAPRARSCCLVWNIFDPDKRTHWRRNIYTHTSVGAKFES